MSSEPYDEYDTMVDQSLETGRDGFSRYSSAEFQHQNIYLTVLKRPDGYNVQWPTERPLPDLFDSLESEYRPEELINAVDSDGQSYMIDPDAWEGMEHDLIVAEIPYSEFKVEWTSFEILTEGIKEKFSELTLTSSTSEFDIEAPHFTPARRLYPELADRQVTKEMSRKVFDDIKFYLEDDL